MRGVPRIPAAESVRARNAPAPRSSVGGEAPVEPCLHCGAPVPFRWMGCKGGHCPNCRHPYPHGDCSD